MPNPADPVAQLAAAGTSWSTVRGRTRWWRRQALVNRAFTAHFDRIDAAGGHTWSMSFGSAGSTGDDPADDVIATELAVTVQRVPWKLRADLLTPTGDGIQADVLVVDGTTYWARTGAETTTNAGNPQVGHGGGDITHLLDPGAVPELFDLTVTGTTEVAGRPTTTVTAARRPGPDGGWASWPPAPFAMITGGDLYRLSVDLQLGILLRVVKVVDGLDAETTEFTAITIDQPLPDELFSPLPHARVVTPVTPAAHHLLPAGQHTEDRLEADS